MIKQLRGKDALNKKLDDGFTTGSEKIIWAGFHAYVPHPKDIHAHQRITIARRVISFHMKVYINMFALHFRIDSYRFK